MADDLERSSTDNNTISAEGFPRVPTATVSSLKSEDSTEQLICKSPQKVKHVKKKKECKEQSVCSKSVEAGSEGAAGGRRRAVVLLGLGQVVLGVLLVCGGALGVVKGAALARVGAGLWAGCLAVVAGVVGVLAGINDCYGLNGGTNGSSPLLTAFLALSLLCLACGNSAAVLAATGLQRDSLRAPTNINTFEDEMEAWTPVLSNIALLIIASVHCLVCIVSIYQVSKRVCPCFRPKQAFDHNQFDPAFRAVQPYVVHVDEGKKTVDLERVKSHELCKELEVKLQADGSKKKKDEPPGYGSANSKEKLVTHWLGRHQGTLVSSAPPGPYPPGPLLPGPPPRRRGVRKQRKPGPGPVMLLPAHPASTFQDDAGEIHGLSQPTVSRICARVARAIARHSDSFIKMPESLAEQQRVIGEFSEIREFPTVLGCIDCTHIKIKKYGGDAAQYYINRKGFYSLNVQLGRMPMGMMMPPPRYATLPLPPAPYAPPPGPMFYSVHDPRVRRRRSPREERRRRRSSRERESQLTRSLERIHRKRRAERLASDADLKRTYTGLDRAYAEQFIAACAETRHAAERLDSLTTTDSTPSRLESV